MMRPSPSHLAPAAEFSPPLHDITRATLGLSAIYWSCMFVADSLLGYFIHIDPIESAPLKFVLYGASALMTCAMSFTLFRLRTWSFMRKALLAFAMTGLAAPIYTAVDFMNYKICQYPKAVTFDPVYSGYTLIQGASQLFGWCCLFIALLYSFEVRDRERRLAAIREEALAAQMQALQYQINPHFLFNTLNAIAELIQEQATTKAERMVMSLSTFLRTTLSLDPLQDVSLADELSLQMAYLEIERERYCDRMTFNVRVPDSVRTALVPSLILQPLIENAIKHGIGKTTGSVEMVLEARHEGDRLQITIENDAPAPGGQHDERAGMGLGLRNVAERLRVRFQGEAQLTWGPVRPGRYRVVMALPWRQA